MTQSESQLEELCNTYIKTAANIISYYEADERKEKLQELREIVKNNCAHKKKLKRSEDTKKRLLLLYNEETETDIEAILKEYKEATSEMIVDVSKDDKLIEYDREVEALLQGCGDKEDDDEDMQLSGGYVNVIDPISKKRIVNPVKNTVCGHTYDRESITEMLKINKKTRCPVIGCRSTEFVALANLRTDIVTQKFLEKNPV